MRIGLEGTRRTLDVGRMNDERFAVMAGAGFDAQMIKDADGGLKDRFGRLGVRLDGTKQLGRKPFGAKIKVDGATWFDGQASSVLIGNVGKLFAGVEAFEDARPDDGKLELGVVTADGLLEWTRTIARTAIGSSSASPFVQVTKATSVQVKFDRKILYELDGGDRKAVKKLNVEIEPAAITVCVPARARTAHEHRGQGSRDLEADGRRRAQDPRRDGPSESRQGRVRQAACRGRIQSRSLARVRDLARPRAGTGRARRIHRRFR